MKKIVVSYLFLLITGLSFGQAKKTELFDLIKKFIQDSTGYSSFGDWAVGKPSAYPVKWDADRVEMSEDEKINFFRMGTADLTLNGMTTAKWNIMLRGPRGGFTSFNISSPALKNIQPKQTIDSLFGIKKYTYKLLQSCDANQVKGFYYYELKIPKKDKAWCKVAWTCKNEGCMVSIDCYDEGSKEYAELACSN